MIPMQRAFEAWGVQTFIFDYPNDGPLRISGRRLRKELFQLSSKHPRLDLVVVAHSMGGLVARYALERVAPAPSCVTDLFTLGTPHQGSRLAVGQPWLEVIVAPDWQDRLNPFAGMRDGVGQVVRELLPGSEFLKQLNAFSRPAGIRYHVAAGRQGFLSEQRRRELIDALQKQRARIGKGEVDILRIITAPELQTGKGDGAVTVESATKLHGAITTRVFELNHIELIRQKVARPEEAEVFRWIVDTLHWSRNHAGTNNER